MRIRASDTVPKELVDTLTAQIPQTLDTLGPFKSITSDDIAQMLQMEALKQSVGCDDVSCLAEIGGAIGAQYLITGTLVAVGSSFLLQFQMMDIHAAKVAARVSRDHKGDLSGLLGEVEAVTKLLVRDILAEKSGTLLVTVSEEGATIRIDGSIVGVSPMEATVVGGGLHTVAIEKEGFIKSSRDVTIHAGKQSQLSAVLLPSADYKRNYESKARLMRNFAWTGLGIGAAGLLGFGGFYYTAGQEASGLAAQIEEFNAPSYARSDAESRALTRRRDKVALYDTLALASGAVALTASAVGVLLYLLGDDPSRFTHPAEHDTGVGLVMQPSAAGVGMSATLRASF